ncbi:MAG: sigma 54-interacting transcriptional regulator [Porticoccus sp.]|nr:sigma 54-interacting transcriptional regulator [Porticoccus sp.]
MQIIAKDTNIDLANMLNGYDCPAILVTPDYRILATNQLYLESFGEIDQERPAYCYKVSHNYDVPCDQAGENCPLSLARESGQKERVLHIHQTARGKEHVDVEMLPIMDSEGNLKFFVELLKPVTLASPKISGNKMVGASFAFNNMVESITRVGPTEASVLLLGESGTGKELAALAIHSASNRNDKPMVTLECAGLTETLFESELFGHMKGAFTGASYNKLGLIEAANGGTLFLDEIGDVPFQLQVKLLRLIETGTYRPVGSQETKRADFRLICATHKDIFSLVEQGEFRQDLYYRINVFPIYLPSLNQRSDDIALLAKTILKRVDSSDKYIITDSAISLLKQHHYVGNIRELKNILSRAIVLANTPVIDQHVIKNCLEIDKVGSFKSEAMADLKTNELLYLQQLLKFTEGDKEKAATIANISVRSLYRKLLLAQEQ